MAPLRHNEDGSETRMTTDERFERIEHVTLGLAEERRKDREESCQLWRARNANSTSWQTA